MAGVLTPLVVGLLARGPEALGLAPDGDHPGSRARGERARPAPRRPELLCSGRFWSVSLPFALGLTAQISVIIYQVLFLRPRLGAEGAAWAVSLTALPGGAGRFVVGLFGHSVARPPAEA